MGLLSIFKRDLGELKIEDLTRDEIRLEQDIERIQRELDDENEHLKSFILYVKSYDDISENEEVQYGLEISSIEDNISQISKKLARAKQHLQTTKELKNITEEAEDNTVIGRLSNLSDSERAKAISKINADKSKVNLTITQLRKEVGITTTPKDREREYTTRERAAIDKVRNIRANRS